MNEPYYIINNMKTSVDNGNLIVFAFYKSKVGIIKYFYSFIEILLQKFQI